MLRNTRNNYAELGSFFLVVNIVNKVNIKLMYDDITVRKLATVLEKKNGGPYNKKDQDKRRDQVHTLHFGKGYSAVKIAETLGVNRNTINEDIKYWYSNIKEEVKQENDDYILRQMGRLESQRSRIVEKITENNVKDAIKYEKMLLDMDVRINNLLMKINNSILHQETKDTTIQEDKIKDMILFLMIKYNKDYSLTKEKITSEIINFQQGTIEEASKLFLELENLGFNCCKKFNGDEVVYDLMEFAFLRRYLLPDDSFVTTVNSLFILETYHKEQLKNLKKKFKERHGAKEKWSDKVFEEWDKENTPLREKRAKDLSETIIEAFEKISDQVLIKKYMNYINVFFGDEKLLHRKMIKEWQ